MGGEKGVGGRDKTKASRASLPRYLHDTQEPHTPPQLCTQIGTHIKNIKNTTIWCHEKISIDL